MRKLFVVTALIMVSSIYSSAQELGVRLGNVSAGNVAIDAVFTTSKLSRIHTDLSFGEGGMGIDVLWDFIYKPLGEEAFNWYAGVGPYMQIDDPFWFGVAGEIGLEYKFAGAPVALGIDWRPALSIVETTDLHFEGFGINIRYIFGKGHL
jgi:hypothetical protein